MMNAKAKPDTTILQMKKTLHKNNGIPIDEMQLFYNNLHLQDHLDLQHYNIRNGTNLTLKRFKRRSDCACPGCVRMSQTVKLTVDGLSETSITLEIKLSETVESLKKEISKKTGVPVARQRLTGSSRTAMENHKPLASYEFADEESQAPRVHLLVDPGTPSVYSKFRSLVLFRGGSTGTAAPAATV